MFDGCFTYEIFIEIFKDKLFIFKKSLVIYFKTFNVEFHDQDYIFFFYVDNICVLYLNLSLSKSVSDFNSIGRYFLFILSFSNL